LKYQKSRTVQIKMGHYLKSRTKREKNEIIQQKPDLNLFVPNRKLSTENSMVDFEKPNYHHKC